MPRILILADDLSGAADTAIACVSPGTTAVVALGELVGEFTSDVLAIDCDTRHLEADAAAERVSHVFRHYSDLPELVLFKKLDSTLRGNVGAELAAVLKETRRCSTNGQRVVAVMAPAFPARGRTTVNGEQLVDGVPLHQSEIWQCVGVERTSIPALLSESGLQAAVLALAVIRAGDEALHQAMLSLAATADVLVCDAQTEEDLQVIARASLRLGDKTVWAGSAGLAYHLPFTERVSEKSPDLSSSRIASAPTLFVIGSRSSVSREQVSVLESVAHIHTHLISPSVLLAGESSREWIKHAEDIETDLQSGRDTLVAIDAKEQCNPIESRRITAALGTMMLPMGERVGALVASGGETARAILDAWEVRSLDMIGEVEAGLPFAIAGIRIRRIAVLTKAGAFGDSQTLFRCREFIRSLERNEQTGQGEISR